MRHVKKGLVPEVRQRRRLELLAPIRSPHLARCLSVTESPTAFTIIDEHIDGPTLATLKTSKSGLSLGEAWRLIADVCSGLSTLHRAGLIHGDISPGNVIVRRGGQAGRAVIIDIAGESEWEQGTPGFIAPEIKAGGQATAASDVWTAARLAVWAVRNEDRQQLGEHLRAALSHQSGHRPTSDELVRLAEPEAQDRIDLPDEARLAAAHLRAQHQQRPTIRPRRRKKSPSRAKPSLRPVLAGLVFIALAVLAYSTANHLWIAAVAIQAPDESVVELAPDPNAEAEGAVRNLTALRDQALERNDPHLLGRLSVPGSPAERGNSELLAAMEGSSPVGLRTSVAIRSTTRDGGEVVVEADLTQHGFTWSGGARNGRHVAQLPKRCAAIHLVEHGGKYLVHRVRDCAAEETSG